MAFESMQHRIDTHQSILDHFPAAKKIRSKNDLLLQFYIYFDGGYVTIGSIYCALQLCLCSGERIGWK